MKNTPFNANEVKSGFLVVLSIAALLGLLLLTGSSQFLKKSSIYHVQFNYISGLKPSAPVHYAGFEVGEVASIEFIPEDRGKVRVTLAIDQNIPLKTDSEAFIEVMGFMGETFIELKAGSTEAARLQPGGTLTGFDPVPLMELVKKGSELLEEFQSISTQLKGLTGDISTMVEENHEDVNEIVDNLNSMTGNLNYMTRDLKYHPWKLFRKGKERDLDSITEEKTKEENAEKPKSRKKRLGIF